MRKMLLLAVAFAAFSITAAQAQNAPTYQPPSGVTPAASSTGAVPATGATSTAPNSTTATQPAAGTTSTKSSPAASPATGSASVPDQKIQKVVTQIIDETAVAADGSAPPPVAARLPNLKMQPKLADIGDKLDYVQIVGTTSSKIGQNGKSVGIQWTTITRTDTGQTINIDSPLSSSLRLKGDVLPAKTKVTAKGDADELYTAIQKLFQDQPGLQTANTNGSASKKNEAAAPSAGTQASTNGDVQAQPLKTNSDKSDSSNNDPVSTPVYDTTTDGCTIRVDLGQMSAIQQESTTTTLDGKTTKGACEDGGTHYPIVKTGLGCDDVVGDKQAQGQTKLYYVGTDGKPVTVQDCSLDAELVYPFVDEPSTCTPFVDYNSNKVLDQVETVYRNAKNTRIVVQACHPTGDGYDLEKTTDGCSLRDDFTKQQTIQQDRQYYTKGGVQMNVGGCQDSTTVYAQQTEACSNIVDTTAMKVFKASRIYIDGPTGKSYRSECAPSDAGSDLQETTQGCESTHYDYPSADQSRGASRLFYMDGGAPVYLTQCQENTTVYKWNFIRNGWKNDDTALSGTELLEAHITLPAGDTLVSPAAIRPESAVVAYVDQGTTDIPNGQAKSYQGCDAYSPTTRSQAYQRPDATTYTVAIGPGDLAGPVDECTRTQQSQQVFDHACTGSSSTCGSPIKTPVSVMYISSTLGTVTINAAPNCGSRQDWVVTGASGTGLNWAAVQVRTVTTLPAGAGGTSTTGAWTTQSYLSTSSFIVNKGACESNGE